MEVNNPFESTINNLNKTSDEIDKATREANKTTSEENNNDPAYVLYNAISESSIKILPSRFPKTIVK